MGIETQTESKPSKPNSEHNGAQPDGAQFIDEGELLRRLPVSRGTIHNWRRAGKLPFVRLSGRRILYHWPTVQQALLRMQHGGGVE